MAKTCLRVCEDHQEAVAARQISLYVRRTPEEWGGLVQHGFLKPEQVRHDPEHCQLCTRPEAFFDHREAKCPAST